MIYTRVAISWLGSDLYFFLAGFSKNQGLGSFSKKFRLPRKKIKINLKKLYLNR